MASVIIRKTVKDDVNDISKLLFEVQKVHSDARSDLFIPGGRKYNDDELLEIINDISRPYIRC